MGWLKDGNGILSFAAVTAHICESILINATSALIYICEMNDVYPARVADLSIGMLS